MKTLSKGDLLNAPWPAPLAVEVPELGGRVYVRVLLAAERDELEVALARAAERDRGDRINYRGCWVALCAADEQGNRLFTDDDASELGRRPASWIDRIFEAARRHNRADAGAVEEEEKNCSTAPG